MRVVALCSFKANGVRTQPGQVLTPDEILRVGNSLLGDLHSQGLVQIEESQGPTEIAVIPFSEDVQPLQHATDSLNTEPKKEKKKNGKRK